MGKNVGHGATIHPYMYEYDVRMTSCPLMTWFDKLNLTIQAFPTPIDGLDLFLYLKKKKKISVRSQNIHQILPCSFYWRALFV